MALVTFEDGPAHKGEPVTRVRRAGARTFFDGTSVPLADGQLVLSLRRLPVFLRVVQHKTNHTWDALDQEGDEPGADEDIYVYVRSGYGHARGLGVFASYRQVEIAESLLKSEWVQTTKGWRQYVDMLARHEAEHLRAVYKPEHALHG